MVLANLRSRYRCLFIFANYLSAAVFGGLFVVSIHMMNIQSVPNPSLSPSDLTFIENFLTTGGIATVIVFLIVGWLLIKRWK
jgi:hypothetical protein